MDARIAMASEERRLPSSFHAASVLANTSILSHHDLSQRHRGSSQSDGRDSHVETPPQQPPHASSPAAASVDSFSSYINKDAPLFQNRSSSPRAEDQLRDNSDPASRAASPHAHTRHLVTTPIVSRDAFRHQPWPEHEAARSVQGVMSIEHLHSTPAPLPVRPSQHAVMEGGLEREPSQGSALDDAETAAQMMRMQRVPASPSPAIDINRLSAANLAQQDQENEDLRDLLSQGTGLNLADDSFENSGSVMGDDSKNEIRRRRRTRPDEANLLAQVYAKNPFPDHETRLFLANRVGMSVR